VLTPFQEPEAVFGEPDRSPASLRQDWMVDLDQLMVEQDPQAPPRHIELLTTRNDSEVCEGVFA
jgi:hypothetical protein